MAKGKKGKDKKKGKKKEVVKEVEKEPTPVPSEKQPCDDCSDEDCYETTKRRRLGIIKGKCRNVIAALLLKKHGNISHNLIMVAEKKPSPVDETKKKKKKGKKGKKGKKK